MSKMIEGIIECPFYIKEGESFITCEGVLENTSTTHRFKSREDKRRYEFCVCGENGGKKCSHFRAVSLLYERGLRT
jgi:hypothetical protein